MSKTTRTVVALGVVSLAAVLAAPAALAEKGDWIIRGGATMVDPKSNNLSLGDLEIDEGVVVQDAKLAVDSKVGFGFNVTYMLTDNWGVELLAALPFKHDIDLCGTVSGVTACEKIAQTKHLPPTLSLQYHFLPDGGFRPYVGAGINVTLFSSEKLVDDIDTSLSLDTSTGPAVQVGVDIPFGERWLLNFDVRWIDIDTKAKVTDDVGTETLGTVKIDPFVYSIMLGMKF